MSAEIQQLPHGEYPVVIEFKCFGKPNKSPHTLCGVWIKHADPAYEEPAKFALTKIKKGLMALGYTPVTNETYLMDYDGERVLKSRPGATVMMLKCEQFDVEQLEFRHDMDIVMREYP